MRGIRWDLRNVIVHILKGLITLGISRETQFANQSEPLMGSLIIIDRMAEYVKYKLKCRLGDWGKSFYINGHCIAKKLTQNVIERYVPGFGHVVELEIQDWVLKQDKYRGLLRLELDENDMFKDPAKKKQWEEMKNSFKEEE